MSEWISVDESLPPIEQNVLCWDDNSQSPYIDNWTIANFGNGVTEGFEHHALYGTKVTHWTPLPGPPTPNS